MFFRCHPARARDILKQTLHASSIYYVVWCGTLMTFSYPPARALSPRDESGPDMAKEQRGCPTESCIYIQMHGKDDDTCPADTAFVSPGLAVGMLSPLQDFVCDLCIDPNTLRSQ